MARKVIPFVLKLIVSIVLDSARFQEDKTSSKIQTKIDGEYGKAAAFVSSDLFLMIIFM